MSKVQSAEWKLVDEAGVESLKFAELNLEAFHMNMSALSISKPLLQQRTEE